MTETFESPREQRAGQLGQDPADEDATAQAIARHELVKRMEGAAAWFFWIALLSIVNVVLALTGSTWSFLISLAVTDLLSQAAAIMADDPQFSEDDVGMVRIVMTVVTVLAWGALMIFAERAKKGALWAFGIGIGLYAADTVLALYLEAWLNVAFHVWALTVLWGGMQAARKLRALDAARSARVDVAEFGAPDFGS